MFAASGPVKPFPLEEEYKKNTKVTPEDIRKLRQWLDTQPHLPAEHITDLDLILTFHCVNRSAEVAKQVLDLHYTLKTLFTSFFKDRKVDDKILKTMSTYALTPLETRAYDDSAIIYCGLVDYDPKNFVFADAVRACLMVLDLWQYSAGTWPGFVIVIDLDHATISHITRLDVQSVQQFLYFLQEAMLLKIKSLHFLNAPSFMDRLMMILRPFLKKELLEMLSIHQIGSTTIGKFFPIEALPKDAGGQYKTRQQCRDDVIEKFTSTKEFFVEENKKRVVEAKRPGKPKTISDIFGGVEGSFKKLDID
ncbi:clavesin-1-like [Trichoplusia ni]|uniref:Clavesin-1-like n=1 Tax=Trichoplusia ni TaxID=7111 RepID=A0A7E5WJ00_TRINI|nr:clavesin-1-like [Trichoplusia ni]